MRSPHNRTHPYHTYISGPGLWLFRQ
jgi:hypothetical protein